MKAIKNISILAIIAVIFTACFNFDDPERFEPREPSDRSNIITIDSLKRMLWTLDNSFNPIGQAHETTVHAAVIPHDVYIQGRIISDDRDGNFFNQIFIQDETSGINVRIGRTGLYNFYRRGQTIYVRMQGLTLAFRRGMYEIGDIPDPNAPNFPTTVINIPRFIYNHILAGPQHPAPVPPQVVSMNTFPRIGQDGRVPNDGRYNMMLGTLVQINNVTHVGTNDFFGNIWEGGIQIALRLEDSVHRLSEINTWALSAQDASRIVFDGGIRAPSGSALTVTHFFTDAAGDTLRVRTSGFARFAGDTIPQGPVDLVGVLSLHSGRLGTWFGRGNNHFPDYQLAIRDLRDVTAHQPPPPPPTEPTNGN